MKFNISSASSFSGSPTYRPASREGRAVQPSGTEKLSMSPRQTEALLPSDLSPAGQGADQQEVKGKGQEQSLVEDIRQTAEKANAYLRQADTHLEFNVSEQTGRIVVAVVDSETREVVRQIPPESMMRLADRISHMRGLLFDVSG